MGAAASSPSPHFPTAQGPPNHPTAACSIPSSRRTSHASQRRLEGAALHDPLHHLLLLALGRAGDSAEDGGVPDAGLPLVAHEVLQQEAVLQRRRRRRRLSLG